MINLVQGQVYLASVFTGLISPVTLAQVHPGSRGESGEGKRLGKAAHQSSWPTKFFLEVPGFGNSQNQTGLMVDHHGVLK